MGVVARHGLPRLPVTLQSEAGMLEAMGDPGLVPHIGASILTSVKGE